MGFNTFGPLLVVDAQLTPAAGVVGTVVDATTEATVATYDMSGNAISLVTNARGYVGQFQAPDTSVMLRLTFGDLALDAVAKEVIAAGGGGTGGVTSVDGKTGAVSLSDTYVAPTGTDSRLQVAGVDVEPEQVGAATAEQGAKADLVHAATPVLSNLIENGNFSGTGGWTASNALSTATIAGGSLTMEVVTVNASVGAYASLRQSLADGDVYYTRFTMKPFRTHFPRVYAGQYADSTDELEAQVWATASVRGVAAGTRTGIVYYMNASSTADMTVGAQVGLDDVVAVNLTATFGAGNEPTKETMDAIMDTLGGWFDGSKAVPTFPLVEYLARPTPVGNPDGLAFAAVPGNAAVTCMADTRDGVAVGIIGGRLARSTNGWESYATGFNVATPHGTVISMHVWHDGSLCIVTATKVLTATSIWATPTVTLTATYGFTGLGVTYFDDGDRMYVILGEYTQGDTTSKPLRLSVDGGATWSIIKMGGTNSTLNNHWHATAYDPWAGAIWAAEGDTTNRALHYSTDLGATWGTVTADVQGRLGPTLMEAFPTRIMFGRDDGVDGSAPGMDEWVRTVAPLAGTPALTTGIEFDLGESSAKYYPHRRVTARVGTNVAYVAFVRSGAANHVTYVYATADGGVSWRQVYRDTDWSMRINLLKTDGVRLYMRTGMGVLYSSPLAHWTASSTTPGDLSAALPRAPIKTGDVDISGLLDASLGTLSGEPPTVAREDHTVFLDFRFSNAAEVPNLTTLATLAPGFRPTRTLYLPPPYGGVGKYIVYTTGAIKNVGALAASSGTRVMAVFRTADPAP